MGRSLRQNSLLYLVIIVLLGIIGLLLNEKCDGSSGHSIFGENSPEMKSSMVRKRAPIYDQNLREYEYGQDMPIIFIGGYLSTVSPNENELNEDGLPNLFV